MKTIVKSLCFAMLLLQGLSSTAQLKLPRINNAFTADIKQVIKEYPHQFSSLIGTTVNENPQTTEYECTLKMKDAESTTITRYSSGAKKVYSWQALMLVTEDFETARKKFKQLYGQLNNMAVKMNTGVTFYIKGKYAEPTDEKKFASAMLGFEKPDASISKMKLEVSLQYLFPEWRVSVRIFEREREDDERGEIIED